MFSLDATPFLRRVAFSLIPGIAMLAAGASSIAHAQNTDAGALSNAAASFSSSTDGTPPAAPEPAGAQAAGQNNYPSYPRRQHSWANRLAFEVGGGANGPGTGASNDIGWGGNFTVGAGYKFTSHIAGLIEYQFLDDKLPGRLISEVGANGGNAHIWGFTVAPVADLFPKKTNDIYFTGGGGFYRKVTNFTDPGYALYCDYYFCGVGVEDVVVGHFSSNQAGWNIGGGYTYRLRGSYSNMKLFAEARYLDVQTPASASSPNGLGVAAVGADTIVVPITLGVRF